MTGLRGQAGLGTRSILLCVRTPEPRKHTVLGPIGSASSPVRQNGRDARRAELGTRSILLYVRTPEPRKHTVLGPIGSASSPVRQNGRDARRAELGTRSILVVCEDARTPRNAADRPLSRTGLSRTGPVSHLYQPN